MEAVRAGWGRVSGSRQGWEKCVSQVDGQLTLGALLCVPAGSGESIRDRW